MKATETQLLKLISNAPQFVIPIYQRTYSWTERECQQLWDDIIRAGESEDVAAHFAGSVVYIKKDIYENQTNSSPLLVIDGQQRLTTVMLIIEALARQLGDDEPIEDFSAINLREEYLLHPRKKGERRFKLLLNQTDKSTFLALLQQRELPSNASLRIADNFAFFQEKIAQVKDNLAPVCLGLSKLIVVDVALTRGQDNPQLIFESMNSTGRELDEADLIRNFILMGLEPDQQTQLYEEHWRLMEEDFGQEAYTKYFDKFIRDYLTLKTGDTPNVRAIYEAFKKYARSPQIAGQGVVALVADIHQFARYYCAIALRKESDKHLAAAFHDLRELKVNVAYPFLLELYHDYAQDQRSQSDFVQAVRLIESYVFRRAVCSIPTNSLNKTFATLARSLDKDHYLESLQARLMTSSSYRRFPHDEEFKREFIVRDLYNFPRQSYWLRRMENWGTKECVSVNEYTTEHIMPQNKNLSQAWRNELGTDWQRVQETWLHTPGNLTLTGYNSEYSDRPFAEKRDREGGFKQSPLRLNRMLGTTEHWNEDAIKYRAGQLADRASQIWAFPDVPNEALEKYFSKEEVRDGYSIQDHPYLSQNSPMRPVFDEFRKVVLALDPNVTEEFLKLYVAYKAETNFVDVVPLKSRLRLSINLHFDDLDDPRSIAKDVTKLGRWGNGDVEVGLSSITEIPYIMGLVRQAFEKQMSDDAVEVCN